MNNASDFVTSPAQLKALSGPIAEASGVRVLNYLHPHYQAMIAASPFALLATHGSSGLDVSPRGDPAGFVHVEDEHTLLLPERRGNNCIDSLQPALAACARKHFRRTRHRQDVGGAHRLRHRWRCL